MRITSKGQVTIPIAIREKLGFLPNTEVDFVLDGDGVRIVKAPIGARGRGGETRGERAVRLLREGRSKMIMSTEELLALTRGE